MVLPLLQNYNNMDCTYLRYSVCRFHSAEHISHLPLKTAALMEAPPTYVICSSLPQTSEVLMVNKMAAQVHMAR